MNCSVLSHVALAGVVLLATLVPGSLGAQNSLKGPRRSALVEADSLFRAGERLRAEEAYRRVLALDATNSRAVYQLGVLRRADPHEALLLFVRYVDLEPGDPWGPIAVAETYSALGRTRDALVWYRRAEEMAPTDRDIVVEHLRALARSGHTEAAIHGYRRLLARQPNDPEAWSALARELFRAGRPTEAVDAWKEVGARQPGMVQHEAMNAARTASAPQVEFMAGGARDSDQNAGRSWALAADLAAWPGGRAGARARSGDVRDGVDLIGLRTISGFVSWRPSTHTHIAAELGATRLSGVLPTPEWVRPVGKVRVRWIWPGGAVVTDLGLQRDLVGTTPSLLMNRVVRQEARGTLEVPVRGPFHIRTMGRLAELADRFATNRRTAVTAAGVVRLPPSSEMSIQAGWSGFQHPSAAGYYAPRASETVQATLYSEVYSGKGWGFATDVAAGVQRVADHGAEYRGWRRALGFYGFLSWSPVPRVQLRIELELQDAAVAPVDVAGYGGWRYGSLGAGMRWSFY